jgi:hypothetical protein
MRFQQFCVVIALVIGALGCGVANAAIRDLHRCAGRQYRSRGRFAR